MSTQNPLGSQKKTQSNVIPFPENSITIVEESVTTDQRVLFLETYEEAIRHAEGESK